MIYFICRIIFSLEVNAILRSHSFDCKAALGFLGLTVLEMTFCVLEQPRKMALSPHSQ